MPQEKEKRNGKIERREKAEEKNGKIEGAKEKSIEIAKEMLKKGIDTDLISEITKLTKEEIDKILKE